MTIKKFQAQHKIEELFTGIPIEEYTYVVVALLGFIVSVRYLYYDER